MPSPFPSGEGPPCAPVLRSRRRGSVRIDSSGPWAVPEGVKCPRERRADGVVTTLGPADLGHSYTGYKPGDKQKTHNHSRPPHRCRERLERGNEIPRSLTKIKGPSPLDSVRQAARAQPLLLFSHPPPPCGALSTTRAGGSSSHTRNNTRLAAQGTASQEFKHDNRHGCTQWSRMYHQMGGSHHGHDQGFVNHRGQVSSIAYPNRVSSIAILTCVSDRSTL